ncbi:MAG: hypothetical protein K6A32_09460 [Bacteroidales bacterium]|nr:hypothetical protein [Bacteroidales bacterium]
MIKRKSFRRAKVNCLCRCTPKSGIIALNPAFVKHFHNNALTRICASRSTGEIAAIALRIGKIQEQTGHYPLALHLYRAAINNIYFIDSARAEDYYENGPSTANPHYRYWYERTNDADALEVATRLDALLLKMGFAGDAHQRRRICARYEALFRNIYAASM